jgi:CRP/FNR family cyclic AMP-dependent transcriptional regulator
VTSRHALRRRIEGLRALSIFADCPPRAMRRLSLLGTQVTAAAGRHLTTAGTRGAEVVIVLSGSATCLVAGTEVAWFGPGDFFGEVAALDGGPRTATVVAITDMELLVLSRCEFALLIKSSPEVAHRILGSMAHRLRQANALAVA